MASSPPAESRPGVTTRRGLAAAATSSASSRFTLTDADVDHVRPGTPDPGGDDRFAAPAGGEVASLSVNHLASHLAGNALTVRGEVVNSGQISMQAVVVEAVALGADGSEAGRASAQVATQLAPGGVVQFTLPLTVTGAVSRVHATVRGDSGRVIPLER